MASHCSYLNGLHYINSYLLYSPYLCLLHRGLLLSKSRFVGLYLARSFVIDPAFTGFYGGDYDDIDVCPSFVFSLPSQE